MSEKEGPRPEELFSDEGGLLRDCLRPEPRPERFAEAEALGVPEFFDTERLERLGRAATHVAALAQDYTSRKLATHHPADIEFAAPAARNKLSHVTGLEEYDPRVTLNIHEISNRPPGSRERVIDDARLEKVYLRELIELYAGRVRSTNQRTKEHAIVRHGFTQIAFGKPHLKFAEWLTNAFTEDLAELAYQDLHERAPSRYARFEREREQFALVRQWLAARNTAVPLEPALRANFFGRHIDLDLSPYLETDLSTEQFLMIAQAPETFCPDPAMRKQAFAGLFATPAVSNFMLHARDDMLVARKLYQELPALPDLAAGKPVATKSWKQFLAHHELAAQAIAHFPSVGSPERFAMSQLITVYEMVPLLVAAKHYPQIQHLAEAGKIDPIRLTLNDRTSAHFSELWLAAASAK